jgi:hypothetical protein
MDQMGMALPQPVYGTAAPGVVRRLRRCVLIKRVQRSECNVNSTNYREARPESVYKVLLMRM